ncbi:MAG: hypothetical protein PUE04_10150 [Lachnospira sp.]|nr:hypothetical protein [Lachnospira sp.]
MKSSNFQIRKRISELLWTVAILLYGAIAFIRNTLLINIINVSDVRLHHLAVLGVILLLIKEILEFRFEKEYILKSLILGVFLGVVFLVSFLWAGDSTLQKYAAQVLCYVFAARNISWKHTGTIVGCEFLLLLLMLFLLSNAGRLPNFVFIQSGGSRVRESIGFSYCLQFMACFLNAVLLLLSARENKIHIVTLALLLTADIVVYSLTDARIGFTGIGIAVIAALINKLFPQLFGKIRPLFWVLAFSPIIYMVLSVIFAELYNPDVAWMNALDEKLESRLALSHLGLKKYGLSLFGQYVDWHGAGATSNGYTVLDTSTYNWVDNVYIKELIDHGIIYEMFLLVLLTIALIQCMCEERYLCILLIALLYGVGLIDDNLRLYCYNSMILFIGVMFMRINRHNVGNVSE